MRTGSGQVQGRRRRRVRVARALSAVFGAAGVVLILGACHSGKQVLVDMMHPPSVPVPAEVTDIDVEEFQGPAECAKHLKQKLVAKVTESGRYKPAVPGLSEPSETLTLRGSVSTCALSLGSGTLNTVLSAWYMGEQIHQAVVEEHTNRPGAPSNEVRDVLVDRVTIRMAKPILPLKRKEIRKFYPIDGDGDAGMGAASNGNWPLAIDSFGKQIKEKPNEHRAWYNRGIAYEATGRYELAMKDLRKALELKQSEQYVEALARVDKEMQSRKQIDERKKHGE